MGAWAKPSAIDARRRRKCVPDGSLTSLADKPLDLGLLGDLKRVVYIDAEIPRG